MPDDEITYREVQSLVGGIKNDIRTLHGDMKGEFKRNSERFDKIHDRITKAEDRVTALEKWRAGIVGAVTVIGSLAGFVIHKLIQW